MPIVEDLVEGALESTGLGIALAAGTVVALLGAPVAKPVAKRAIMGFLAATHAARSWAAETVEQAQDLYAEAKYEYESQLNQPAATEVQAERRRRSTPAAEQPA